MGSVLFLRPTAGAAVPRSLTLARVVSGCMSRLRHAGCWRKSEAPQAAHAAAAVKAPTKKCPDCAETILTDAKVCKHCGYRFSQNTPKHRRLSLRRSVGLNM